LKLKADEVLAMDSVINNGFDFSNALMRSEQIAQQCPHREELILA
jgi:hypothetical protein